MQNVQIAGRNIVSECPSLAQREYKNIRHDEVAAILHWKLCKKYGIECANKDYEHHVGKEDRVTENSRCKILWDLPIQTDVKLDHNRQDVLLLQKETGKCFIIDVAYPFDYRLLAKEKEKIEHYTDLRYEILKCWRAEVKRVEIIPVVVGALGCVSKNLTKYLKRLDADVKLDTIQKAALFGTARILRKVLDSLLDTLDF